MRKKILAMLRGTVKGPPSSKTLLSLAPRRSKKIRLFCVMCGKSFKASRKHKRTCSSKCRTAKSRSATFMGTPVKDL